MNWRLILRINSQVGKRDQSQRGGSSARSSISPVSWASSREGMKRPSKHLAGLGWAELSCASTSPAREGCGLLGWGQIKRKVPGNGNGEKGCQNILNKLLHLSSGLAPVYGINFMKDALICVSLWYVGLDQPACFKWLGKKRKKHQTIFAWTFCFKLI